MKQKRIRSTFILVTLTLLLTLMVSAASAANFSVDNFDSVTQTSDLGNTCTTATGADMLGGERDIEVARTVGGGTVQADVDTSVANSFAFSIGSGTRGTATIQLDGIDGSCTLDPTGLGGISLNPYDGLSLFIQQVDLNGVISLRVYTDGSNYSTYDHTIPYSISSPGHEVYFPFSDFVDVGTGADFGNVGAIEVIADGTLVDSLDMSIDFVSSDYTRDYGDLPSAYNNTLEADNGARHIAGGVYFGSAVDTEDNGQESTDAEGDNTGRDNDEAGISSVPTSDWGDGTGELGMNVTKPVAFAVVCAVGWIDWDQDNSFEETSSIAGVSELVANSFVFGGANAVNFTTPTLAEYGGTYPSTLNARFRIFQPNEPLFTSYGLALDGFGCPTLASDTDVMQLVFGEASDGEVEDYQFGFGPTAVSVQSSQATGTTPVMLPIVAGLTLLVLTGGLLVLRRRQIS